MIPFHSLLLSKSDLAAKAPMAVAIACGVILLFAFIAGVRKGFRRVNWGGMFWLIAAAAFVVIDKKFADKLPLDELYAKFLKAEFVQFATSMSIALAVIVVTLIVQLLCNAFLRPRIKYVKRKTRISYDGYGFEYEEDGDNFDDEYYADDFYGKKPKKIGYGKPRFFTRIMGGLANMLNAAVVLAILVCVGIFIVSATKLASGACGEIFQTKWVEKALLYASSYLLDFVTIGIIFGIALFGYKKGFAATMRAVLIPIGATAAFAACCVLPFMEASEGDWALLSEFVERCVQLFKSTEHSKLFGRVLAAALMATLSVIVWFLLGKAFTKFVKGVKSVKPLRVIDGILACILFFALGVALCTAIWSVLYAFEYCGLFYTSEIFNEKASLANGFYEVVKPFMDEICDKYLLRFA